MEVREIDLRSTGLSPAVTVESFMISVEWHGGGSHFLCDDRECAAAIYNSYTADAIYRWQEPLDIYLGKFKHKRPRTADEAAALHVAVAGKYDSIMQDRSSLGSHHFTSSMKVPTADCVPVTFKLQVFSRRDGVGAAFVKFMSWRTRVAEKCDIYLSPWLHYALPVNKVGLTGAGGIYYELRAHAAPDLYDSAKEDLMDKRNRLFKGKKLMEVLKVEQWQCVSATDAIMTWYKNMPPVYCSDWSAPSPIDALIAELDNEIQLEDADDD